MEQGSYINVYLCLGFALQINSEGKPQMPEVLKERLDCLAEEIQKDKFNETSLVIVSGRGKVDIEANFMAEYLSQKHSEVMKDKILIVEAQSMNSVENFLMSFFQLWQKYREEEHKFFKMKVVTSSFHAERVKYIGEQCIPKLRKSLQDCNFSFEIISAKSKSSTKTEEPAILWQKADEKLKRIMNFEFDENLFMKERQFSTSDQELFPLFVEQIKSQLENMDVHK